MKLYLKQLPLCLWVIFLGAIFYVGCYRICFTTQPEIFPGAKEAGVICYNLALSCIASFVFYYFSIHVREEKTKDETMWFIYKKLSEITYKSRILYEIIKSKAKDKNFNYKNFENDFSEIWHDDRTGWNILDNGCKREQTFADLYYDTPLDLKNIVTEIYIRAPFIEPQILNCLLEIEECEYMRRNPEIKSLYSHSRFIYPLPDQYIELLKLINNLEEYLETKEEYIKIKINRSH